MDEDARRELYHIVGIGGIGMSAIAEIMRARGFAVQGSDQSDSANAQRLRDQGIRVFVGHDDANLEGATHVIVSTAIKPGNPELDGAQARGVPVISRAEMLGELMRGHPAVAVTGTHGKTTTTSLIAWAMTHAGCDPTVINGGILNAWGSNARAGAGEWMVVEADESDATFVKLPTRIGVVTNIDPEHMDFYSSERALHATFRRFFEQIPYYGAVVAGIDHPVVREILDQMEPHFRGRRLLRYGWSPDADLRLEQVRDIAGGVMFDARLGDRVRGGARLLDGLRLPIPGEYNALNALAAIAVMSEIGLRDEAIEEGLRSFCGVARRFTPVGDWNGVSVYDDYAHHPVEIAAVLKAARHAARGRVIAVMQPHRYSRLTGLLDEFAGCFSDADIAIITPVYSAGETGNGVDHRTLLERLRATGHTHALEISGEEALAPTIAELARPGDLVIGLGAGTITNWAKALPERLRALSVHPVAHAGAAE
ncbi:UDP-N-acetylmuramate--L-alanine ligase [Dichotomicrobium thermohalophilum]|uniref:UDP-N-acetylmuramate--L-alanine ligase n=1 Tax=Dichotomicrobium thermohalophilum TaxID=933063 RepID=A0A397PIP2_9HYPH|nr:UDP-N-acetylmuramate--L-alanine ligase [Dichotomicrobium thermohalophilum]RIA47759.1 UDP-N-acetylmuramate--L-alanine ligase [Dichotomicrobium thermohalophilum]